MEVTIFTLYSNRPDFIKLQKECFRKNLKDKFRWIVVNNPHYLSDNPGGVEVECLEESIEYLRINHGDNIKEVSRLVVDSLNFLWQNKIKDTKGLVVIMDSDLFLTKEVSFVELLKGHDMFLCPNYTDGLIWPWPGFMGFDMNKIVADDVSFELLEINGICADVGSGLNTYIQKHNPKINLIPRHEIVGQDYPVYDTGKTLYELGFPKPYSVDFLPFALHYKTGSNYAKHCTVEYNLAKTEALLKVI